MVYISSEGVRAHDQHTQDGLHEWNKTAPPQRGLKEQCYFHKITGNGIAAMFQPSFQKGIAVEFDTGELDCFTQRKMMGYADYVMGFEPGNCLPTGTEDMKARGLLKWIKPGELREFHLTMRMLENPEEWMKFSDRN